VEGIYFLQHFQTAQHLFVFEQNGCIIYQIVQRDFQRFGNLFSNVHGRGTFVAFVTSDNGGGETDDDLCALCETYGYLCDECPYWELQDSCTTCTELGLMDCNKCEYEEDPCVRCQNMEIPDCKECALTLRYIRPRTIQVEYSLGGLGDSTKASLIRITEEALYAGNNGAVPQIRSHARMAVVGTAHEVQTDTLNYLMEIDMTDQFIYSANGDSVLTVLSSRVSDELALAGLAQSAKAPQFIQEVVSMAGNFWNNNTTLETDDFEQGPSGGYEGYFENPDLFALHLNYGEGNDVVSSPGQLNGNISGMTWGVQGHQPITYGFWYDGLNRLTKAESGYKDQNQLWLPTNYWGTLYTYDNEGNILSLKRRGILEECPDPHPQGLPAFVFDQIDNLGYTYSNNRLQAVNENAGELKGYKGTGGTYQYDGGATDGPGNITYDGNKDISIEYNYLNLPEKITFNSQGSIIEWTYDATGRKIKKVVSGSSGSYTQLYLEGVEYKDNQLISIQHEEGRAVPNAEGTGFRQEFVLRDHLGNARVHFSDLNGDGALQPFACNPAVPCVPLGNGGGYTEMLQVQHYYPFGMEFDGPWEMPLDPDEINHYTYNGKELNRDFGLGWLDYGFRWYDPAVGRFPSVDPLAEQRSWVSPYNYVQNNPVFRIDPTGALDHDYIFDEQEDGSWKKREGVENDGGEYVHQFVHKNGMITTQKVLEGTVVTVNTREMAAKLQGYLNTSDGERIGKAIQIVGDGIAVGGYMAAPLTEGASLSVSAAGEGISVVGKVVDRKD
jgi:RHS repeat-associated protein